MELLIVFCILLEKVNNYFDKPKIKVLKKD